ncbi:MULTISPECIES: ABC transporter substrate-binding protein [Bacillaceae]|uniref:ABC transporter substrate-binding protein n=1 Tax=Bacillaceae TaxID=186817 RepID=UPI001E3D96B4|nr:MULTISPECIES: ABC transporter substrate-binding protein [Bacillaceae]MCE4050675.1 ABC transporter substrate-binding protein [Bacillus sp. Au-Bac7]MCM3031925.1 ABC transporter substrate-binding protein [Niallia sp. MER 6]MDL0436070.1 ABC transporter substrate-binding protein [Niallia sp. SS-2023]UPO87929.1 ABC transporter substrate-binding protein [Niallia sp. Man26]
MKKYYSLFCGALMACLVLAGCGQASDSESNDKQKSEQAEAEFPVTITDAVDKEVVIEEDPQKIVSLMPSNTEVAFALGVGDEVVGVSESDDYPEETKDIEKVVGMELNVEKILSLDPDLVLAHESVADTWADGLQQMSDAGIDVLVVNDATDFNGVYNSIEMIGKAVGEKEKAEEIVQDMKDDIASIKEKAASISEKDKKDVYVEVSPEPSIFTTGKDTFMQEMIDTINATNVIKEAGWVQVDQEAVIEADPDVVITTYGGYSPDPVGQVTKRDGWDQVTAVKDKQIVEVDEDLVSRSGPRLAQGVEEFAKAVYPDVFK